MLRKQLNKLAARILKGQVRGVVIGSPTQADPCGVITGWIYGRDWHISFPPNPACIIKLPASTLDGKP